MLKIPNNITLYETPIATYWFLENGIMCSASKKEELSIAHYKKVFELFAKFTAEKKSKVCLLSDGTKAMPMNQELREYVTKEAPKYIKAHAIVTDIPLDSTRIVTFMKLAFVGYPIQLCSTVVEAEEWLKNYL